MSSGRINAAVVVVPVVLSVLVPTPHCVVPSARVVVMTAVVYALSSILVAMVEGLTVPARVSVLYLA